MAPDASTEAIKKAYYKRALKLHPDKNPGDEQASKQFQSVSEAYQVLADGDLRARYDRHGAASLDVNFMDGGVFFTMLFGSERFEPYIGRLALASAASMEGSLSMHRLNVRQQKREVELALRLVEHTQLYVDGDVDSFREKLRAEARELLSVSFGPCLLFVVAEVYAGRAEEFLGYKTSPLGITGHFAALNCTRLSVANHASAAGAGIRAAGAAIRTFQTVKEIAEQHQKEKEEQQKQGEGGGGGAASASQPPHSRATPSPPPHSREAGGGSANPHDPLSSLTPQQLKATQESLPIFLEAMWHVSVVDIERTLTTAIYKCCRDHSVDEKSRLRRGEAIAVMGALFMAEAVAAGGSKDPRQKVGEMVQLIAPQMAKGATDAAAAEAAGAGAQHGGGASAGAGGGRRRVRRQLCRQLRHRRRLGRGRRRRRRRARVHTRGAARAQGA